MRFYNSEDEEKLNRMVADGAIVRDTLEKAVGDRTTGLIEALVDHAPKFPVEPWIAWGVRKGLARVNRTKVTPAFIRDLKVSEESRKAYTAAWAFPFARNIYGQTLVAVIPGFLPNPQANRLFGENPVHCLATLTEMAALRMAYAAAR